MFFRYDVSKFTNIPLEDPALKFVLANLDSDTAWDVDDPIQKAMLDAGELRFDLSSLKRGYKKTNHEEYMEEKHSTSKEKATKTKDGTPSTGLVRIKEENKLGRELKEKMAVLKSAKGEVSIY